MLGCLLVACTYLIAVSLWHTLFSFNLPYSLAPIQPPPLTSLIVIRYAFWFCRGNFGADSLLGDSRWAGTFGIEVCNPNSPFLNSFLYILLSIFLSMKKISSLADFQLLNRLILLRRRTASSSVCQQKRYWYFQIPLSCLFHILSLHMLHTFTPESSLLSPLPFVHTQPSSPGDALYPNPFVPSLATQYIPSPILHHLLSIVYAITTFIALHLLVLPYYWSWFLLF